MGLFDLLTGRVPDQPGRAMARSSGGAASTLQPQTQAVTVVPYADARGVLGLSPVWRAINLIADSIADMPWTEWSGNDRVPDDAVSRLVVNPFSLKSRRWWTWRVVATECLYNRVYCLHVGGTGDRGDRGEPWSLLPIPPAIIAPITRDPFGLSFPDRYTIAGREYSASDITIIERAPFPSISEAASGLLDLARRQFSAYLAADVHMQRYWTSGGPTTAVLTSDQELDNDAAETLSARWRNRRAMGADFPAVLGKGAHAESWGADPTTESAVESRREVAAEVGRYFGLPTRLMNAPAGDSETYSNVENDAIDVWRYCLRGYAGPVEDAITLHTALGRRMQLDPSLFLQGDLTTRAPAYSALVTARVLDQDEARRIGFGLPPLTDEQRRRMAEATTQLNVSSSTSSSTSDTSGQTAPPAAPATVTVGG